MPEYDAVVIGAGPNGLTLANYLVTAGLKTLMVEGRYEIGGNLITEDFDGARYNLHALYMFNGAEMPPYADLRLKGNGGIFVKPPAQATVHLRQSTLTLYRESGANRRSISRTSKSDSTKFEKLTYDMNSIHKSVVLPMIYNQPLPPARRKKWLAHVKHGRTAQQLDGLSPLEIISDHYHLESEELRTLLLYLGCVWGVRPTQRGVGLTFLFLLHGMLNASMIRGGSYLLASSLYNRLVRGGGEVLEGRPVTKILVEKGKATGVVLSDGTRISSRIVVSTLDVKSTVVGLLGKSIGAAQRRIAKEWKWDPWSLFQAHWTLKAKPRFNDVRSGAGEAMMHVVGYGDSDDLVRQFESVGGGRAEPAGCVTFTTNLDSTQAPSGLHVAKFTAIAPFKPKGTNWEGLKDRFADQCFAAWARQTNISDGAVLRRYAYPPTYIPMKLANCVEGSLNSGAYIPGQLGYRRPSRSISSYATPLKNLYLCGASVHPGGMVTLAGGYNAAATIASEEGIKRWWKTVYSL